MGSERGGAVDGGGWAQLESHLVVPVLCSQIESRLDALLEEQGEKLRAALFNLVLHVPDRERSAYVRAVSQRVREHFPCRMIYLGRDEGCKEPLEASVGINPVGQEITCDQIEIHYRPEAQERVPLVVLPHLLADLPVVFFWPGDPAPGDAIFELLRPYISRLVIDPDTVTELPQFHGPMADLKWAHLDGWRLLLSSVFNGPERLEAVADARKVRITYSVHESQFPRDPRLHAIYLQAWLASRLGWGPADGEGSYQRVKIELHEERDDHLPFGSLKVVEIVSHGELHTRFTLRGRFVEVSSDSPERCMIPYALYLPSADRSEALVREIFRKGTSAHYRQMREFL